MFGVGTVLYAALLLINAMAILNEERFLTRSTYMINSVSYSALILFFSRMDIFYTESSNADKFPPSI